MIRGFRGGVCRTDCCELRPTKNPVIGPGRSGRLMCWVVEVAWVQEGKPSESDMTNLFHNAAKQSVYFPLCAQPASLSPSVKQQQPQMIVSQLKINRQLLKIKKCTKRDAEFFLSGFNAFDNRETCCTESALLYNYLDCEVLSHKLRGDALCHWPNDTACVA